MKGNRRARILSGTVLIVLGLALFWLQSTEGFDRSIMLGALGGLFIAGYLYGRSPGLLIPGCILLGLASGWMLGERYPKLDQPVVVGLGCGFLAIYLIGLLYERRAHWWPLIPGVFLLLAGLSLGEEVVQFVFARGWPLILVIIGLLVLLGAVGKAKGPHPTGD